MASATDYVHHWSFALVTIGVLGALSLMAVIVVAAQIWLVAYYNPWGFSIFPLREVVLVLTSGIIVCFAGCFIGMLWNSFL